MERDTSESWWPPDPLWPDEAEPCPSSSRASRNPCLSSSLTSRSASSASCSSATPRCHATSTTPVYTHPTTDYEMSPTTSPYVDSSSSWRFPALFSLLSSSSSSPSSAPISRLTPFSSSVSVLLFLLALCRWPRAIEAGSQQAQPAPGPSDDSLAIDSGWILSSAYLVFFMQAGFAMLEAGTTRAKNSKNILLKNLVDTGIATLVWFAVGHAFAFGEGNAFIGTKDFFLYQYEDYPFFMFQWAFATTAVSIISGPLAERTQFTSFLIATGFVAGWIYPVIAHWAWSEQGWLRNLGTNGFIDYAGGGVVHMVGGGVGLIGAIAVGPRMGRFDTSQKRSVFSLKRPIGQDIPAHSSPLVALGIFVLWFGWFGFNSGSTLGLTQGRGALAGRIAVNTVMASTSGSLSTLLLLRLLSGQYNLEGTGNGLLTGAVAVTSSCAVIEPWTAMFIGVISGFVYIGARQLLFHFRVDDPLEAAHVHFFGGLWGLISVGLFAQQSYVYAAYGSDEVYGLFYGGGGEQLGIQLLGCTVITGWVTFWALPLFLTLHYFHKLRVPHEVEVTGLDITKHGGSAYPYFVHTSVDG